MISDFFADLRRTVGGDIRTDETSRILYSTDASLYQVMPHGVCFPRNADEVTAIVALAGQYGMPIVPRAGGTGLAGQTVNEALILDFSHHMNQVLEVNTEERWARVQPGLVFSQMNAALKSQGLMFGPDPASGNRAGLGGIVGNNATGSHSVIYGMAVDHVLDTQVVLSDGTLTNFRAQAADSLPFLAQKAGIEGAAYRELMHIAADHAETIRNGTPKHWRRCGGYNLFKFVDGIPESPYRRRDHGQFSLAQLMCGSEGTLGVMTEFKLNLVPTPKQTALAILHFDDAYTALDATQIVLQTHPTAVELLDHYTMALCRTQPAYRKLLDTFVEGLPNTVLITEYYGADTAELEHKIGSLQQHLKQSGVNVTGCVPLLTPAQQAPVWKVRKAGLGLIMSKRGDFKPVAFIEDTAVPVEHLADHITQLGNFCESLEVPMVYYAHASGGCMHVRPMINTKVADGLDKMQQISEFTLQLVRKYGGAFSSEHGDGRARSWLNARMFGPELYGLFKDVKQTFDPDNIFNPGNIVDAPAMTENLRFGTDYSNVTFTETLDFSHDQGFNRAVEMCNGAGVCRKLEGTMCPPYMVTREEEHSTRGRANMLRAAITGKIPADRLTQQRMYDTMDLCVACKACKTECPSSVDMAKIKMQFLHNYQQVNGTPLRAKVFGNIHRINRVLSGPMAPLVNWGGKLPVTKWLNEALLGVGKNRTLPQFARQSFTQWFATRQTAHTSDHKVVLFNDTFNTYNDPQIAIAATQVLEAAGFEVLLPQHNCCGRPLLSKGLLAEAKALANDTIERLYDFASQGIPIVGLEPSCLLSFRDDYHYLIADNPKLAAVSDNAFLFEEFIAKLADEGTLNLEFKTDAKTVLLHGHCHQKALAGTETAKKVLALPGYTVTEVDSGCCGMAGSFGYEKEHVEISLKMGERALFPAVRATPADTIIAAAGTSCREQIYDGTTRLAKHPAEVLNNALAARIAA